MGHPRKFSTHKNTEKLAREAIRQGWVVEQTHKGHVRFLSPDGAHTVVTSGTPKSDHERRLRGKLRRAGLDV